MAAYNNYYPAYQYPVYQQPVVQTQYQPQIQQPVQQAQANQSGIVWVTSEREAALFPLAPNNAIALWNQNDPVVYLKQADASGRPTMKVYDLVERVETPPVSAEAKAVNASYATKEDLGTVVGVVKDFDKAIVAMRGEIETMKGDLYGIAGKKKPAVKKPETEEE